MPNSTPIRFAIALGLTFCAGTVMAQGNPIARSNTAAASTTAPVPAQEGFFRPTPDGDPSLTKPRPAAQSATAAAAPAPVAANMSVPPLATLPARGADSNPASAIAAVEASRWTEEQMDRAEREADRDRQRAMTEPKPIYGAFDGTTSERNR